METDPTATLQVPAADMIRLVQTFLTEQGLHQSCACLAKESGVGAAAAPATATWESWANSGQWGLILQQLAKIDRQRTGIDEDLIHRVHQIAILELASLGEWELAYASFRAVQNELEKTKMGKENRSSFVSRKLNDLALIRNKDKDAVVPDDFFGEKSLKDVRKDIGKDLYDSIPVQPANRLLAIVQQSIKWQTYTGDISRLKEEVSNEDKRQKRRKVFDIVRGESYAETTVVGSHLPISSTILDEPIVHHSWHKLKFAKNTVVHAAAFSPDGSFLVTGTSDGFIEIYQGPSFQTLKSLPYQSNDECLIIDSGVVSLAVSRDANLIAVGSREGKAKVYNVADGHCLREFQAFDQHVTYLDFAADGTRILACGSSGCREFGLRANRILQEMSSPASSSCCTYWDERIVTGSSDGMVRLYRNSSCELVWNPENVKLGASLKTNASTESGAISTAAAILCVKLIRWHQNGSNQQVLLIASRSSTACVVNSEGEVLAVFPVDSEILAVDVSPSHRLLYLAVEGGIDVFDLHSSERIRKVDVGFPTSTLVHHPIKPVMGMFSTDANQKRGVLHLWK